MKQYDPSKPKPKTGKLAKANRAFSVEAEAIDMIGFKKLGKSPRTMSKVDYKAYHKSRGTKGSIINKALGGRFG